MRPFFVTVTIVSLIFAFFWLKNFSNLQSKFNITPQVYGDLPKLYPYPMPTDNFQKPPPISARSAIVIDAKTGITLFEKDPDVRHLPASTTKLMTALVALERCSVQTPVRVNNVEKEGTQMGLSQGDVVTIETLIYGLLISSGNDAAYALAYSCSDSYDHFVNSMNQKAKELEMANTYFTNPAGFDDPEEYSTARDLVKLAKVAVSNPLISKIVAIASVNLTDISGQKTYYLENVNKLLGQVEGIEGVKTGQTEGSLEILLTKTTRQSNTIIVAILGSLDRFGESKQLIEWAFANHHWLNP